MSDEETMRVIAIGAGIGILVSALVIIAILAMAGVV